MKTTKYVWVTLIDRETAWSVIVEAVSLEEAKIKVAEDVGGGDDEVIQDVLASYGTDWFLQELAPTSL